MSQQPSVVYLPRPSNSMGLAGFIVSLVGWVSCGLLCPIGLLLSLIGLRKDPRGFAVAGVILGALGTVWAVVAVFFGGIALLIGCGGAVCGGIAPQVVTHVRINMLAEDVEKFERVNSRMPDSLDEAAAARKHGPRDTKDAWGRPLRLHVEPDGTFTISSDGPDRTPDTADDIHEHRGAGKHAI